VAAAMNGLPVVRFNASANSFMWFYRPVQDDFTIICVFQSTQGYGSGNLYYQGAGLVNGEVSGVVNDYGTCLFANGAVCAGTGSPDVAANSVAGYNNGHPHILTFMRKKSTGLISLYMDGLLVSSVTGGTESLTAPSQLVLGALQTLNNYLSGDIAEVQVYNTALSVSERSSRETALKCEYGLTGGTTPAAPAGLTGTVGNRETFLYWTLTPGATTCSLWRSTNNGVTYVPIATGLTTSSYADANAVSGQTNFYEVASSDDCGTGVNSAAVAVYLPLPTLGMNATANTLQITWPGWATGWNLYVSTNLTPPIAWVGVTNSAANSNGVFTVILPLGSENQYFRLGSP